MLLIKSETFENESKSVKIRKKNHGFRGNKHYTRKKANVTAVKSWIRLVTTDNQLSLKGVWSGSQHILEFYTPEISWPFFWDYPGEPVPER